jgi:hypothetical protein
MTATMQPFMIAPYDCMRFWPSNQMNAEGLQ